MIPLSYSIRNLKARRLTTALTATGMALVVFVFAAILMLAEGLRKTLVQTGSYDNAVVIRKGSETEVQSAVQRAEAGVIETSPEIATGMDGRPMMAKELVILITLPKRETGKQSNVMIRGVGEISLALRPSIKIIKGRMPRPGSSEIATGRKIAEGFKGAAFGETLRFAMRDWRVVGVFDAGNSGFSSEIWADADQLMQAFRRPAYSSVLVRLKDPSKLGEFKERIGTDPRLTGEALRETEYYEKQSRLMARFLRILGISLTVIFSMGAVIGAIITMYSSVANRTAEIGTLRALGFQRKSILMAFMAESIFLGLLGGLAGLFFASFLQFFTVSTMNFQTFSELAFSFTLTFSIAWRAILFSLLMGFLGGVAPAFRAARMNIVDALRAA
jgi:putative ABC transport system permease protein